MSTLSDKINKLVQDANFTLRADVKKAIQKAYRKEKKKAARKALGWILDNAKIAKKNRIALCQDTGIPVVFIEAGLDSIVTNSFIERIGRYVVKSYKDNFLRKSIVDPLERKDPSYQGVIEHVQFSAQAKGIKITLLSKGFGSENKTQLKMFQPTAEIDQIEEFILESVRQAGPEGCPPFFIGIGIGGTSEYALYLAKKALLEPISSPNPDKQLNGWEKRLLRKVNKLGIGPMGLGGKFTALGIKVKKHPTHIAGLPVAINISCHALRSATVKIKNKG